jgi:hypothetical protein
MTATAINRAVRYRMCSARSCWSPAAILDERITGNADLQVMSSDDKHQTWCEEACFERTTTLRHSQPAFSMAVSFYSTGRRLGRVERAVLYANVKPERNFSSCVFDQAVMQAEVEGVCMLLTYADQLTLRGLSPAALLQPRGKCPGNTN